MRCEHLYYFNDDNEIIGFYIPTGKWVDDTLDDEDIYDRYPDF